MTAISPGQHIYHTADWQSADEDYIEFHKTPVSDNSTMQGDFVVERVKRSEFPQLWDVVDDAFQRKRPRALYRWQYLDNPFGIARCWGIRHRASARLVRVESQFPWPLYKGAAALRGGLNGDWAGLREFQGVGLTQLRWRVIGSCAFGAKVCAIAGPNASSRAILKAMKRSNQLLGQLPGRIAPLRGLDGKLPLPLPPPVGKLGTAAFAQLSAGLRRLTLRNAHRQFRLQQVDRFDAAIDLLTDRGMSFPGFWSRHCHRFLNWRYLDHPVEDYRAYALLDPRERAVGYAVLRFDARGAVLSDFVVDPAVRHADRSLLSGVFGIAQEAGADFLSFYSTPGWRHDALFRSAGMLSFRSGNYQEVICSSHKPEVEQMSNWQLNPGDRDYR